MRYKFYITLSLFLSCFIIPNQSFANMGEVLSEPLCFGVINTADFRIYGRIGTDVYVDENGNKGRHMSNFNLAAAGSKSDQGYPIDRAEFCSYGPFYEGRKVEFVVRTLFPVFRCQTRVDQGPIYIEAKPRPEGDGYTYSATCYE